MVTNLPLLTVLCSAYPGLLADLRARAGRSLVRVPRNEFPGVPGNQAAWHLTIGAMVADNLPILYTKNGCPWCHEAVEFLDSHGISYKLREVTDDPRAMDELRTKSGQTKAPTLDWHGKVLADFGVDELIPFLHQQNVQLEDS